MKAGASTTDLSEFLLDEKTEETAPPQEASNETTKQMNISSYFTDQTSSDDPFSSSAFVSVGGGDETSDKKQEKVENVLTEDIELNFEDVHHQHLEPRLSHEEPESVDFQLEGDMNVMEGSMQVIDDKEDFEMFTAENDPNPEFTEYGVSPGTSLIAERINQMHMSESGQSEADQSALSPGVDRQMSSASQHSIGSTHSNEQGPPPPLPVSQFSSNQFSPFATPTHQPIPPPVNVPSNQLHSQPVSPNTETLSSSQTGNGKL